MHPMLWRFEIVLWASGSRFSRMTIGLSCPSRSSLSPGETVAIRSTWSGLTMTANGCSGRPSLRFSSPESSSVHARWNPPIPRMATIEPVSRSRAVSRITSGEGTSFPDESRRRRDGPHAAQAIVWAWCLRLAGSPYSFAHAGQGGNSAIEVLSRS